MNKKKIEIVDVKLDIDISEEIKSKVDSLSSEVIEHTKELIKKNSMKIQRINKKKKAKQERLEKAKIAIKFLEESFGVPERWVEGFELAEKTGINPTSQEINKLSMQMRKLLTEEDKWALSKKRRKGKTVYRLVRFS